MTGSKWLYSLHAPFFVQYIAKYLFSDKRSLSKEKNETLRKYNITCILK